MAGELGFDTGPYVNIAAFCEKVLQEQDGVLSLIRIIDKIDVSAVGPTAPDELPAEGFSVDATLVLVLKPGEARGSHALHIVLEHPSGERNDGPQMSVAFNPAPNVGVNVLMPMKMAVTATGLYWADVFINDRLVTRVPLEINYGYRRLPQ